MTERTYPHGVPSWVDLEVDDVDAACAFYGDLFGWTFARVTPDGIPYQYLIASLHGHDAAGIGGPPTPGGSEGAGWTTFVAVDDIETVTNTVVEAGGAVVEGPQQAGEGGIGAVVADPRGARFALWQARNRLGAQVANVPGAWNFSDLHVADVDAARGFYGPLFGWEFADLGFATMIRRPGYGDHLAATADPEIYDRQARVSAPPDFADAVAWAVASDSVASEPPHWSVTFTVADRDAAAQRVEPAGGRVIETNETDWTRTALIADPSGARLTLSQFAPPEK